MENFKNSLLNSSRKTKVLIVCSNDLLLLFVATYISIFISELNLTDLSFLDSLKFIWTPFFTVLIFYLTGVYRSVVRYINFGVIFLILRAITLAFFLNYLFRIFFFDLINESIFNARMNNESLIDSFGLFAGIVSSIFLVIGSRLIANYFFSTKVAEKKVVIYGSGSAGIQLAEALRVSKEMQPIAFLDKNTALHNTFLGGIKILPPNKLKNLVRKNKVDEVLIAIPSATKNTLRTLLKEIEGYSVKVRILPGLADLAQGKVLVSGLKEVDTGDLLGRTEVEANKTLLTRNIEDKVVLITGSGGSIGSEISRQVVKNNPKKIILLDSNEYALFSIKNEIEDIAKNSSVHAVLANITDSARVTDVCRTFGVDTIYHAAAYKHVSLVEENPFEAVSNNIFGTKICAESAIATNVETFVLISTDKAVRPTNIMGATKRFAELILQSMVEPNNTKMIMVRFGNVIGSSGSAIPLFQKQIKDGGPVTVTHPEVVRYFMSIPEAAELVIQAGAMGVGGEVFVLDMGEPVKIVELAKKLIQLSGMALIDSNTPDGDIEIKFTGLRPGEKLYEELLIGDNVSATEHQRILKAQEESITQYELENFLQLLEKAQIEGDILALRKVLKEAISGYKPDKEIVDVLHLQKAK